MDDNTRMIFEIVSDVSIFIGAFFFGFSRGLLRAKAEYIEIVDAILSKVVITDDSTGE